MRREIVEMEARGEARGEGEVKLAGAVVGRGRLKF